MKLFRSLRASIFSLISLGVFLFKIVVGTLVFVGLVRFLDTPFWDQMSASGLEEVAALNNLEPAVNIVGTVFVVTWVLRFWDQAFPKKAIAIGWGILGKGPLRLSRFFTAPLVHGNFKHLAGNTWDLLLFMGIAILVMPTVVGFAFVTLILILVHGIGVWRASNPVSTIGASGLVLGYFSFNVFYNFFVVRSWGGILIAVLIVLWRGRPMYRTLINRNKGISFAAHMSGFIGGIIAAASVPYLGL